MPEEAISSLWIGNRLSTLERLSIHSFLAHGHEYRLYAYGPIENAPLGADIRDARDVLSADEIFYYRRGFGKGSPSAFSNLFRYKLLFDRGGWWCDLDVVCLRPFRFDQEHVLGGERTPKGGIHAASAVLKTPAGSPLAEYCWRVSQKANKRRVRWGQIGPRLVDEAVAKMGMEGSLLPPDIFYPIDFWDARRFVTAEAIPASSHAIHFWHARWNEENLDPDARFDESSLYEQLKRRYLPDDDPAWTVPLIPSGGELCGNNPSTKHGGLVRRIFRRAS